MVIDTVFYHRSAVPNFIERFAEDRQSGVEMTGVSGGGAIVAEADDRQYVIAFQERVWSLVRITTSHERWQLE